MSLKRKTVWLGRLKEFMEKKNFYVMVILCIGILVFSGLFMTSRNIISSIGYENEELLNEPSISMDGNDETRKNVSTANLEDSGATSSIETKAYNAETNSEAGSQLANISEDKNKTKKEEKSAKNVTKEAKQTAVNKDESKVKTNVKSNVTEKNNEPAAKIVFDSPVKGKVSFDYSMDKPLYSKTLNEWRTHAALDIKDEAGTPVRAVRDGIVKEVINDPRYGYTVVIEHDKGLRTVYAAMVQSGTIVPNQKVKAGDVIGSLGNTAAFEALEPAHLHFEVLKDGKNVDPKAYLPQLGE